MSAEAKRTEVPTTERIQDYIIDMLFSLAQMASDAEQFGLAERIRHAADSSVVYL
jgi:hypothetical protein